MSKRFLSNEIDHNVEEERQNLFSESNQASDQSNKNIITQDISTDSKDNSSNSENDSEESTCLLKLENEHQYELVRNLCIENMKMNNDLNIDEFITTLIILNSLKLRGKTLEIVTKKLAKFPRLKEYIPRILENYSNLQDISISICIAVLDQQKCMIEYSRDTAELEILTKPDSRSSIETHILTILRDINLTKTKVKVNSRRIFIALDNNIISTECIKILVFFLYGLHASRLVLDKGFHASSQDIIDIVNSLLFFNKPILDELSFTGNDTNVELFEALKRLSSIGIKKLEFDAIPLDISYAESFTCFKRLVLNKGIQKLDFIKALIPRICKSIQELSFGIRCIKAGELSYLQDCTNLTKLNIFGNDQFPDSIDALLSSVPISIEELSINSLHLNSTTAQKFQYFINLKKLMIRGVMQDDSFINTLINHLPNTIEEFDILTQYLNILTVEKLRKFKKIKRLFLKGFNQNNLVICTLMNTLSSSIEQLGFNSEKIDISIAQKFKKFYKLKNLVIGGAYQDPIAIKELISMIYSSIEDFSFKIDYDENNIIGIIQKCNRLKRISIYSADPRKLKSIFVLSPIMNSLRFVTIFKSESSNTKEITEEKNVVIKAQKMFPNVIIPDIYKEY